MDVEPILHLDVILAIISWCWLAYVIWRCWYMKAPSANMVGVAFLWAAIVLVATIKL